MLTLDDLRELYGRYVPAASRHPNARRWARRWSRVASWWPAHELGHLLTVPPAWIGRPLFGMDTDVQPQDPNAGRWFAYELAAMSVSRRLLTACGRLDLFLDELKYTDGNVIYYGSTAQGRRILRRAHALRLPRSRAGLEAKLRRAVAAAGG